MTDSIAEQTDCREQIIDQLETGDVSLERANELHAEGKELLEELEGKLDVGDGDVLEQ